MTAQPVTLPLLEPPISQTPARGEGHLAIQSVAGQSAAIAVQSHSPLKILVPRPRGRSVWAYLSNFGGGLLPGDHLNVRLELGAGARCFLGTQSSTKIFRSGPKGVVRGDFCAEVGPGAALVYAPDVAQGFAQSAYRQRQVIRLADDSASLIFLDWYSSGRLARGERWAFSEYSSRSEIYRNGRLVFLDSICLESDRDSVALIDRMGRANCVATLALIGPETRSVGQSLAAEIAKLPLARRSDALVVASAIPAGVILRVAAISVEAAAREIFPRLSLVASLLGDNPFQRKW